MFHFPLEKSHKWRRICPLPLEPGEPALHHSSAAHGVVQEESRLRLRRHLHLIPGHLVGLLVVLLLVVVMLVMVLCVLLAARML